MVTYNKAMDVERVFQALADNHRRHLLDLLHQTDGQTLTELCTHLPMTRFGVMKHLGILEEAGLVVTHKVGREKLHYINPIPMLGVADWVGRYRTLWFERMERLDHYLMEIQNKEQNNDQDEP
jgi:DNA-binding transcriptional ArsR family regulator